MERLERERTEKEQQTSIASEDDIVCAQFTTALYKLDKIDIDDTVGAMYDAPYYGRVIEKTPVSIKVVTVNVFKQIRSLENGVVCTVVVDYKDLYM